MRRARVFWLGLLALGLSGCLHDRPARSSSFFDRFSRGPSGPDAVFLEYALIERPAGSAAINREVWANLDEQVLPAETRALLTENGFRVGVVGGLLPSELEAMIANPKSDTGHRQRRLYVNNPAALLVNGPVPKAEYQVRAKMDETPDDASFEQARFSMTFTPSHGSDGRVTLRCVPEVEYLDRRRWVPAGAPGMNWLNTKPAEKYESLAFEVTLSPREFLIVGTHYERGPWLGNRAFVGMQGPDKVQRLLIVRAGRVTPAAGDADAPAGKDGVVPLVSQASASAARGYRE
jgi:hypothetical protein